MKVAIFDNHSFEKPLFEKINQEEGFRHDLTYVEARLTPQTARLANGHSAVASFANDQITSEAIDILVDCGVKYVALRCAGFNHVDLKHAQKRGVRVARVPAYSPYAVAEFAVALLLNLNRKIHRSFHRVREINFSLDGLVGFDVHGKTVGVVGTGKIGIVFAKIMSGFGAKVLACDIQENRELIEKHSVMYVDLETLLAESDIISLHVPLTRDTRYMINQKTISQMKRGIFLINTGRGGLIETKALIQGLKSGHIGGAALDVYEEEEGVFFKDHSEEVLQDDVLARLLTFPNVIITSHQAFLTKEALENIVRTTLENVTAFEKSAPLQNEIFS